MPSHQQLSIAALNLQTDEATLVDFGRRAWIQVTERGGHSYVDAHQQYKARYILLRHERVHLAQRRRMGDVWMAIVYIFPILPIGLAWGRARIEWEAYVETIRATHEIYGMAAACRLKDEIVRRYTSGDYGWMWPFRATVERWFDEEIAKLE